MHQGRPRFRAMSPVPRHPGHLRRILRCAAVVVPGSLFAACAADTGDLLKPLGEAPTAGAVATATGTQVGPQGSTGGSTGLGAGSGTGNATATETSSSTGQTSVDASATGTGSGGSGSSSTGSNAGGSDGSTGTGPASDSGSSAPGGPVGAQCSPTTAALPTTWPTGGLPLSPANYYSGLADGGYTYPYSDQQGDGGGTSSICQESSALCAAGTTGIQSATTWGAGVGVNLNQIPGSVHAVGTYAVPSSATGISYAVTALPAAQTVYLTIDNAGTDYYAALTSLSGHVPWASFKTTPWTPATSVVLGNAPTTATHVEFQVQAGAGAASNFSFCVTSLSFQ